MEKSLIPTISIIVPAYNCEKYLEETVESVIAQTWQDWEMLILDDCSKDSTYEKMRELARRDSRIRIFRNPQNMGAAATRNRGICKAKGEWIAFLDSDDLWAEKKLEKQIHLQKQNQDAVFIFTGSAFIEDDGMTIAHVLHVPKQVDRKTLLRQNVISCSSVLIRKEYLLEVPMPEEEGIHEDFAAWLEILKKVPYAYGIDEPMLIYRRALSSKSGKKGKSAVMNWNTYVQAGIPFGSRVCFMVSYTICGLWKYSLLWWKSYRLMMGKERFKKLFLLLTSAVLVAIWTGTFAGVWFHYYNFRDIIGRRYAFWGYAGLLTLYAGMCMIVGKVFSAFRVIHQQLMEIILSHSYTLLIVNAAAYVEMALIGRWKFRQHLVPMVAVTAFNFLLALVWSAAVRWLYARIYPPHEVLLICGEKSTAHLKEELTRQRERYILKTEIPLHAGRQEIEKAILKHESVMLGEMPAQEREHFLKYCYVHKKRCYCQTSMADIMLISSEKLYLSDVTMQLFRNCGLTVEQRLLKRMFDIVFSAAVLIFLSPLYLMIAIYIRIVCKETPIASRECLTRNRRHFRQYKFRTISEKDGKWIHGGKFLSAAHLDELPQFFNILRGDMSVVGPYPEEAQAAMEYEKRNPEFAYRLSVKAGLTGYAKVHGKYSTSRINQLKMDFYYIQNYSAALDLSIIVATAKVLFEPQRNKKEEG